MSVHITEILHLVSKETGKKCYLRLYSDGSGSIRYSDELTIKFIRGTNLILSWNNCSHMHEVLNKAYNILTDHPQNKIDFS